MHNEDGSEICVSSALILRFSFALVLSTAVVDLCVFDSSEAVGSDEPSGKISSSSLTSTVGKVLFSTSSNSSVLILPFTSFSTFPSLFSSSSFVSWIPTASIPTASSSAFICFSFSSASFFFSCLSWWYCWRRMCQARLHTADTVLNW